MCRRRHAPAPLPITVPGTSRTSPAFPLPICSYGVTSARLPLYSFIRKSKGGMVVTGGAILPGRRRGCGGR